MMIDEAIKKHNETALREVTNAMLAVRHSLTNADKIRAMTDEELAEFLACKSRTWCKEHGRIDACSDCDVCCFEWLKQEVQSDEEA